MKKIVVAVIFIMAAGLSVMNLNGIDIEKEKTLIKQVLLDYGEGWNEGNVQRMKRCLHPDLVKRRLATNKETGKQTVRDIGTPIMLEYTGKRALKRDTLPKTFPKEEVTVFEVSKTIASAKVENPVYVEYMHLVKFNGKWVILSVLWELKDKTGPKKQKNN